MPLIPVAQSLHDKRVFVAGHRGMVGSAILLRLASEGREILTAARTQLDLTRQADVEAWFARTKPQAVFLAAALVGAIRANYARFIANADHLRASAPNRKTSPTSGPQKDGFTWRP